MAKKKASKRAPALLRKIGHAARGLAYAIRHDASVAAILPVSAVVVVASIVLSRWVDLAIVSIVTVQALAAELSNTALEKLCDFVEPRHDRKIGAIKDVAASASGVTILVWAGVVIYEYVNFILLLLGRGR
jgi:diacylglycerol kinase (ATP)